MGSQCLSIGTISKLSRGIIYNCAFIFESLCINETRFMVVYTIRRKSTHEVHEMRLINPRMWNPEAVYSVIAQIYKYLAVACIWLAKTKSEIIRNEKK